MTMKKNIILGITLMLLSLQQLTAQENAPVNASVSNSFEKAFEGAKNVHWTSLPKNVSQAQFAYKGSSWLAYFDATGNIITSGRKIKDVNELPLKVQDGFEQARRRAEKKGGSAEIIVMYEMLKDGLTHYLVSMQNESTISTFSIGQDGTAALKLKKPRSMVSEQPKEVIAKKN